MEKKLGKIISMIYIRKVVLLDENVKSRFQEAIFGQTVLISARLRIRRVTVLWRGRRKPDDFFS
jgi:hypothetical protein